MNRMLLLALSYLPLTILAACGSKATSNTPASPPVEATAVNNYRVSFKVLRQNSQPAAGFKVAAFVRTKSEPETKITNAEGMAEFTDLPSPDATHQLVAVLHYYSGKKDGARGITYPYIDSDAARLKDTQYIPNDAMPDSQ